MKSLLSNAFLNASSLESLLFLLFVPACSPQSICIFIPCVRDHSWNLFLWHLNPWFLLKDSTHHCSASLTVCFCTPVNAVGSCDISFKTFYNTASCSVTLHLALKIYKKWSLHEPFLVLILLSRLYPGTYMFLWSLCICESLINKKWTRGR